MSCSTYSCPLTFREEETLVGSGTGTGGTREDWDGTGISEMLEVRGE